MVKHQLLPLCDQERVIEIFDDSLPQKGDGVSCPVSEPHSALDVVLGHKEQHPGRLDLVHNRSLHMRLAATKLAHVRLHNSHRNLIGMHAES